MSKYIYRVVANGKLIATERKFDKAFNKAEAVAIYLGMEGLQRDFKPAPISLEWKDENNTIHLLTEDAEIKELVLGVDVFPRLCSVTKTGMNQGWYLEGDYVSDNVKEGEKLLEKFVKERFNQTLKEFWDEVEGDDDISCEYYWTEWFEREDCDDEAYLADGTILTTKDNVIYKDSNKNYYKIVLPKEN